MNISTAFDDLGVNAIAGVSLMGHLGLNPQDLMFPQKFAKFQVVVDFLKQFPEDTQRFLINKATRGKFLDKLDHMFEYTNLLKNKESIEKDLNSLEKEVSAIFDDEFKSAEVSTKITENKERLDKIKEEITLYER